jgi:Flp pilus assembly protein TadD
MKINSKIATAVFGLAFAGTAVHAQSLDDAKKAITAEQYQKAKTMLKNLTVTEATKDENYFYLGWVYIKQDDADSAKLWFNKGIAVNPKSSLNYVGLGAVARLNKDQAGATSSFNTAIANASKKDSKPYVYIGKSYLLTANGAALAPYSVPAADAQAAIAVLQKGQAVNPKDPEIFLTLGDADLAILNSNDAFSNYSTAADLDPKSAAAQVAQGVLIKYANNFDDAIKDFQQALTIDPNFGPAYREWAETDARWAKSDPKVAVDKANEAITQYKKYLSLTDMSLESQMRYADFLIFAGKYDELEVLAKQLSASAGTNLRVYRYLGYAAYQNKDYPAGTSAMNTWMTKADPKRIIPLDYTYLGRLQIASGQDSLGMKNLRKAFELDTTQTDVLGEVAKSLYTQKKYKEAAEEYTLFVNKSKNTTLTDYFYQGRAYYFAYDPKSPDTTLLVKADSAFSKIQQKATQPVAAVALFRAYANDLREIDRNKIKGYAKPYYEQFIQITTSKPTVSDADKKSLVTAYDYLGTYYDVIAKDPVKAADNFSKALALAPTDPQALDYQKRKK